MVNGIYTIDSHCHIYPEKIASKAVGGTDNFYGEHSVGSGTVDDLLQRGENAGVDHFIVQSVATTPHQVGSINRFIAYEVAKNPEKLTGLGTLHPDSEDIEGDVAHLLELGLRGVKLHPDIQAFKIDDYSRGDGETLGRFMFGTALDYDSKGISFTPTIKEDDFGIQNDVYESLNFSGAKVYLYDYTAKNDKVIVDASFDNIKAYDKLMKEQSFTKEKATAEASQILIYYTGAYSVKAVIVFKY